MAAFTTATGFRALPSTFHGTWNTPLTTQDSVMLNIKPTPTWVQTKRPRRSRPKMGNVNEGKGLFAPIVVLARNIVGKKQFNQLRGKAIALHSQVITEFCKAIGADSKVKQGLIRLAKKNGERLGFLA